MPGLILKGAQFDNPVDQLIAQKARDAVVRRAMGAGMAGLGVGAGARGLQGLLNQWHRILSPTKTVRKPAIVDMPVAGEEREDKYAEQKQAGEVLDAVMNTVTSPVKTVGTWLKGDLATTPQDVPFNWIPQLAAGAGGIAGGWKGMDMLLDRARERELAAQQEKAREEYEQALQGQSKIGQALHAELNVLYDRLDEVQRTRIEKTAFGPVLASNLYGLYALMSGIPAAVWAYEATKARQSGSLLESARKKYRRSRESVRPTPIQVRLSPVQTGSSMKSAPNEEELEGSPLDKAAEQGLILAFAR
jgi:uncharacterized coiled-coil protein SlyX